MDFINFIHITTGINPGIQNKIIISILIISVLWLIKQILARAIWHKVSDVVSRYFWRKTLTYTTAFLCIILVGSVWIKGFRSAGTFLGLFSAGMAIALKDLLVNIIGWFFIVVRAPFKARDRIQIGDKSGDVIDIRLFQFSILEIGNWVDADQSTGRIIHIPNGKIFTEALANYTQGFRFIWDEIPVLITFESNWKKAKKILLDIANSRTEHLSKQAEKRIKEASRKFMIFYNKLNPRVYTSIKDYGVLLTIRYLCEPQKRRGSAEFIWEGVLEKFNECDDIDFAYPTQRFYDNLHEGKVKAERLQEKSDTET